MIDRSEEIVTVFGGGGFIGRYVCELLMKSGVRVRVAQRNPKQAYSIQTLGQVGQFGFAQVNIGDAKSVRRALRGTNAVINLVGVFGRSMRAAHVDGARNIAENASDLGVEAFVQISAIGANVNSESGYGRTKAEGEEAVRKAFPSATIIRPSLVFGPDDDLTNRFAGMAGLPFLPVIAAKSRFQPIYVRDLAKAIAMAALDPQRFGGQTFELAGPQVMTMIELHRAILDLSGQKSEIVPLPDLFGNALSYLGWLPGAPLTRDQWMMLQRGSVPSGDKPALETFGIKPTPLGAVGYEWLGRFHKGSKLAGRKFHLTATD